MLTDVIDNCAFIDRVTNFLHNFSTMNPSNQPPAPHSANNWFDTSTNPTTVSEPQRGTAPVAVAANQVQAQLRQLPANCLFEYRTWLSTQTPQSVQVQTVQYAPKKPKRIRTGFTTQQLIVLEREYKKIPYLGRPQRIELAETLQLNERTIKIWYQNRRMKEKKEKLEGSGDIQELMIPFPNEVQTYPAATAPTVQNVILEQRERPVYTYGSTKPEVPSASCERTNGSNSSLQGFFQNFNHDEQQYSSVQYKHPVAPAIQMQSSKNFVIERNEYWRNGVTEPVVHPVSCNGSNSALQGFFQDFNHDQRQNSCAQYKHPVAPTTQLQSSQNFGLVQHNYTPWRNGVTQPILRPVSCNGSNSSLQEFFQGFNHDQRQNSSAQYKHPVAATTQMQSSQNFGLEQHNYTPWRNGETEPVVRPVSCEGTNGSNSYFQGFSQDFNHDQRQYSCAQYKHPVGATTQMQNSQNFGLEENNYTPWRNRVTQPVVRQLSCEETNGSNSFSQRIVQDLQVDEQSHSGIAHRHPSATNIQMQSSNLQNDDTQPDLCLVGSTSQQYLSRMNGVTQPAVHSADCNDTVTSKFSSKKNIQNSQQNESPQNFVSEPLQCSTNDMDDTQPDLCSVGSIKTVPLKAFEDFVEKLKLKEKQNSDVQYEQPVTINDEASQNGLSEERQYSSSAKEDPSPIVQRESSTESSSLSSLEDILQDLILFEQQYMESKQRETKQINYFISEQYSPCIKHQSVSSLEQFHPLQTKGLLPTPDLPDDLLDVTPMRIETIDINLYLL